MVIKDTIKIQKDFLWSDLFSYRYGDLGTKIMANVGRKWGNTDSIWWKDLMSIEDGLSQHKDLFQESYRCELGMGVVFYFWSHYWFGKDKLEDLFPVLA